jgi:hypothetical protein
LLLPPECPLGSTTANDPPASQATSYQEHVAQFGFKKLGRFRRFAEFPVISCKVGMPFMLAGLEQDYRAMF